MAKKDKVVEMNPKTENPVNKASYEELENAAVYLTEECKRMKAQLFEARNIINGFNEVGLLLNILSKDTFFNEAFITRCANKIENVVNTALDREEAEEKKMNSNSNNNE